jgi:hypothetical protein
MSILSLCQHLRQAPFAFISQRSAFSLGRFFAGFSWANAAIDLPMSRIAGQFAGSDELSTPTRAHLTSADAEQGFDRLLTALEDDLRRHGDPLPASVPRDAPLLDAILCVIEDGRAGIFLHEPTMESLYETVNGHLCGIAEYDPVEAARQREPIDRFAALVRERYVHTSAPWYTVLHVYKGSDKFGLRAVLSLYRELGYLPPAAPG